MNNLIIETSNLCKCYGVNMVVSHVNIHVQKGSIYGLLGRNGAGKTSIMKMMLGLTPITDGNITMFGMQFPANKAEILRRVGVMIETPGFYPNLTATENLQILSSLRDVTDKNAIQKSLELVGLPYKDKKMFSEYSLGMKQRLGIAASIVHDPELLILDEPTNGLDPIGIAMNCSQIAITDIWKIVISNFISPVCVLVGTLPIILWFSKAKGKYLWGATLSLLLGVSGVFVANGRAVNWHPITYCFSFIQCDSIYTTVLKIPFSCLAIVLYLLLSVIIYVFMYRKQEYPVS